jgi:hypothetical protein
MSPTISDQALGDFVSRQVRVLLSVGWLRKGKELGWLEIWIELGPSASITIFNTGSFCSPDNQHQDMHTSMKSHRVYQIFSPGPSYRLVDDIVPQVEQLPNDLVGFTSNSIVVHDVGREGLATLDLLCCLARVVIVDIHLESISLVEWAIINFSNISLHLLGKRLRIQEPRSF